VRTRLHSVPAGGEVELLCGCRVRMLDVSRDSIGFKRATVQFERICDSPPNWCDLAGAGMKRSIGDKLVVVANYYVNFDPLASELSATFGGEPLFESLS
jgi:hypothetical protein